MTQNLVVPVPEPYSMLWSRHFLAPTQPLPMNGLLSGSPNRFRDRATNIVLSRAIPAITRVYILRNPPPETFRTCESNLGSTHRRQLT